MSEGLLGYRQWIVVELSHLYVSDHYYPTRGPGIEVILDDWNSEVALLVFETFATMARVEVNRN